MVLVVVAVVAVVVGYGRSFRTRNDSYRRSRVVRSAI